jgi:uncharacterized protein (TIGR03118 family)
MHVSNKRSSRSRVLVWCAGLAVLCAQASSFFACSFNTTTPPFPVTPTPPPTPTPAVTIGVTPTTITLGQSAVLNWSSAGVSGCTASGAWSGPQNPAGSTKVTPATAGVFAYVLTCFLPPAGSLAQTAALTVNAMAAASSAQHSISVRRGMMVLRTDLVADVPGTRARNTDTDLSDPWGLVLPEKLPAVAASRLHDSSTLHDGMGRAAPTAAPLLHLPSGMQGVTFGAAGVVSNSGHGFIVSTAGKSAPARLLYGGTAGMIAAWSPEVDAGNALVRYAASDAAAYTGLAIASSSTPSESRLYAADFHNARIDVFDSAFSRQKPTPTRFAFVDPGLPPAYAPFGIAVIDDLVYVAYAQRLLSSAHDPVAGPGLGLIDVFTPGGDFITRLVTSGGALNAPWGMVRAPADGALPFAGALLVGNTGDGRINVFDPQTGSLLGSLINERGAVLVVPNLHGLAFGNDYASQPRTTLFFTAGADGGARGWYGRLDFLASLQPAAR